MMLDIAGESAQRASVKVRTRTAEPHAGEGPSLVSALLSISKSMRALHGLKLGEVGFANGQDELLVAVGTHGIAVNEMADLLMVRPSTVSKMLDRLAAKGLIERVPDEKDARRTMIRITPAGLAAQDTVIRARSALDDDLCRHLDEDSAILFQAALKDCADRLAKRLRRLR